MSRQMLVAAFAILGVAASTAQQPASDIARPAFATASIKPSASGASPPGAMRPQPGGGFSATNATVRELIEYAYQRHAFDRREVIGGPSWIDTDRFDIAATAPLEHTVDADGSFRQTWSMIRTLLANRFKLKLTRRTETDRSMP